MRSRKDLLRPLRLTRLSGFAGAALFAALLAAVPGVVLAQSAPKAPGAQASKVVVVIDASHGGDDSGAPLKSNRPEKALTLALSVRLRSQLSARGMQVVTTRESDATLSADDRAAIANRSQARACISLHVTTSGSGAHLFASTLSPTTTNTRLLPWRTAQSAWINRSLALTGALNASFQQAGIPVNLSRATLPLLDSMACPAVAIEIAPERDASSQTIKNDVDNTEYQTRILDAVTAGLVVWLAEKP